MNTTNVTNTSIVANCSDRCCNDRFKNYQLNSDPKYYNYSNFSYCMSVVTWKISEQVFSERKERDKEALALYKALYEKWKDPDRGATGEPTNDCLGIARIVFCAYKYPVCLNETGD